MATGEGWTEVERVARSLVCAVYGASARGGFHRDPALRDELRGRAVALASAVACAAAGDAEAGALGQRRATSLYCALTVASDLGYLDAVESRALSEQASDVRTRVAKEATRDLARSAPGAASGGLR